MIMPLMLPSFASVQMLYSEVPLSSFSLLAHPSWASYWHPTLYPLTTALTSLVTIIPIAILLTYSIVSFKIPITNFHIQSSQQKTKMTESFDLMYMLADTMLIIVYCDEGKFAYKDRCTTEMGCMDDRTRGIRLSPARGCWQPLALPPRGWWDLGWLSHQLLPPRAW